MVTLARRAQRMPFAPVVALLFGTVSAILVAAVPQWMFEAGVVASGLPTVLAAASPPLGLLARLLAIALAFFAGAVAVWALVAPLAAYLEAKARARTPWRDAGYDIDTASVSSETLPPRRPIFAPDELGAPLMSDEAISPVIAYPDRAPATPGEPLAEDETVDVLPPVNANDSIPDLIRRLENGLARRSSSGRDPDGADHRTPPSPQPTSGAGNDVLGEALGTLRRLAIR